MPAAAPAVTAERVDTVVVTSPTAPIPQTPLAARGMSPGEVTVQFTRWTAYGMTAYQRGQYAGFSLAVAQKLVAERRAVLCLPPAVNATAERMVRK
jgi:hypothetical protein